MTSFSPRSLVAPVASDSSVVVAGGTANDRLGPVASDPSVVIAGGIANDRLGASSPSQAQTKPGVGAEGSWAQTETAGMTAFSEFEDTLRRLGDRIARILQADRCVFLLHDPVAGILYPTEPAHGFRPDELKHLYHPVSEPGISSEVFRSNHPVILYDSETDPRAVSEGLAAIGIRNGASVPLVTEKRDEENRIVDRTIVGVLHVFNKRRHDTFTDEDIRLLTRMATQAAAVIPSAEAYREAAQEKQELIHTIDNLSAGLIMVAQTGRLLQVNSAARAVIGIHHNYPLAGVPYYRAISNEQVRSLIERTLSSSGQEFADEITVKAGADPSSHKRIFQIQCAPMRDHHGVVTGAVAVFNDITEIRGLEQLKTAFISTVSHELRTPLTSIKGFISTLLADTDGFYSDEQRKEFLEIIDTECDRLTRLIKDLLDVSRIEQGQAMGMYWEMVDVPQLVAKVLVAQRSYARNHELSMDFAPDFPLVEADIDKLDQILTNLVNNAIKYSPRGGDVTVTGAVIAGPLRIGGDPKSAAAENDDAPLERHITITVKDQGIGVSKEHLPKLFHNFYRVDNRDNREIGGTGIGLALVKALVEKHHGYVTMDSEVGIGSEVTVFLPVLQPPAGKAEDDADPD